MGLSKTLRDSEPFNLLPEDCFANLSQTAIVKKFPPHTHIFNQDDSPSGFLYVIKEGLVEIVALTPGGTEMVVDHRKEGSFFGGTPVFTNEPYTAGARTVGATECYLVPSELLTQIARDYPHITEYFTHAIFSRVRSLYSDIVSDQGKKALPQMEAYPFQKRLSEIMSSPVETCASSTPAKMLAKQMTAHSIGAILVCDKENKLKGIVTERDLVSKVLASEAVDCHATTAADIMTPNPFTMTPETYMYEATSFMMAHKIKHMPIISDDKIVGIVSLRDLMRYRSQKSMLLVGSIKAAKTIAELTTARAEIVKVARALLSESRSPIETMEILSYIHHSILQRGYELVLKQIQREGIKPPDIRFCFIIMGSGGRKEMLLGPDQDNGFIYENYPNKMHAEVEEFFDFFGEKLVEAYADIGYPRCNGGVMGSNSFWRGRLKDWNARIYDWIHVPEPKKVMYSTIFFDFMPLTGDASLCQDLRDIVYKQIREFPLFLYHMMEQDFKHKVPLGLLGGFSVERNKEHRGMLSLKQAGSIFIVDCLRMYLLENQLDAVTTTERMDRLVEANVFNADTGEHVKAAFEAFTFLRLRNEIDMIDQGKFPSHYLDPNALTKNEQDLLKEAFRAASKLQDSARRHFNVG
jgi:CBS domain-containing protein